MAERTDALSGDDLASPSVGGRFWLIAGLVIAALFAGYWFFLRETYVPVLTGVDPQDAMDILKVLDSKKIPYELDDEGRTILVPDGQADKARIELVGSELSTRGQVGFELFNQSDMGLTEFAQKINYQRALQGELARTILMLDGIQAVRVHLGLPEQSLFRADSTRPKASVAVILKPGATLTQARVNGIQQMIAGAVVDLAPEDVAVLDGSGRIISTDENSAPDSDALSDALIQTYRQRALTAIHATHPGLPVDLAIRLQYRVGSRTPSLSPNEPTSVASPSPSNQQPIARGQPDYALDIRVMTRGVLGDDLRSELAGRIEGAVGFDAARGDTIAFIPGYLANRVGPVPSQSDDQVVARRDGPAAAGAVSSWVKYWPMAAIGVILALTIAYFNDRRRARARRRPSLEAFAEQLRTLLGAGSGAA
jgi:flagellar M-ring protein FliF